MKKVEYKTLRGTEILPYLEDIARLRIEIFRDFPYLYEGDMEYEKVYLKPYINTSSSACVIVFDADKVIGATTCIPLIDEGEVFKKPFIDAGEDIHNIFYLGESILEKQYRGMGIGVEFFRLREKVAKSYPDIHKAVFCAVQRPDDHPLKPQVYVPLDGFWQKRGYRKREDLYTYLDWQDINQPVSDYKKMVFWEKELVKR
jgi:GNAT superfamily N-acetyltransferase